MQTTVKAIERDGTVVPTILLDAVPDICPRCHKSLAPKIGQTYVHQAQKWAQVVFQCTSNQCAELFIGDYIYSHTPMYPLYKLKGVAPKNASKHPFPSSVSDMSPAFIDIFNQASAAESQQLSQLVGIGLRKALEFLIKDFAMHQNPGEAEKIKGMMLGPCITAYIADPNVKDCAKRAAWLGNDETHYIRKWEAQDINDLKLLVRLTTNWVDNVLLTQKYVAEMPQAAQ